jgi:hypothetical protein
MLARVLSAAVYGKKYLFFSSQNRPNPALFTVVKLRVTRQSDGTDSLVSPPLKLVFSLLENQPRSSLFKDEN